MTAGRKHFNRSICLAALATLGAVPAARAECPAARGPRAALIAGVYVVGEAAAIALRHNDWWPPPARSFHTIWGSSPSKGQDALLHASLSYQASRIAGAAWRWACVSDPAAAWLGAATGFALGIPKEIGDGLHQNGFSGTDMLWAGIGSFVPALHRTWAPSRIAQLKVFYWPSAEFRDRTGPLPQLENDYAGQRYFLTVNPARTGGAGPWPRWLGLAVGHSVPSWATVPPEHVWFLALDVDLAGVPVKAKWWRSVTAVVDQIHIPLPGIRIRGAQARVGVY